MGVYAGELHPGDFVVCSLTGSFGPGRMRLGTVIDSDPYAKSAVVSFGDSRERVGYGKLCRISNDTEVYSVLAEHELARLGSFSYSQADLYDSVCLSMEAMR